MARRLVHALVIVLTPIIGATAAAGIVSQTAWFKDWLRGYIEREANLYVNGQISIERLGGNLFSGIELENIGLSMDGTQVAVVKDLGLDFNVFEPISKGLSVKHIRLNQPVLYLRREGDAWSISRLVKKQRQEANRQGPDRPITIDDIGVSDGSVVIDGPTGMSGVEIPKCVDHLDAGATNVVLEYQINKWLRLQSNLLQGASTQQQLFQRMQGSGVDLLLFFSY